MTSPIDVAATTLDALLSTGQSAVAVSNVNSHPFAKDHAFCAVVSVCVANGLVDKLNNRRMCDLLIYRAILFWEPFMKRAWHRCIFSYQVSLKQLKSLLISTQFYPFFRPNPSFLKGRLREYGEQPALPSFKPSFHRSTLDLSFAAAAQAPLLPNTEKVKGFSSKSPPTGGPGPSLLQTKARLSSSP
jgi:hypothetical protein